MRLSAYPFVALRDQLCWSRGAVVFVMKQDQGGCDDGTQAPGTAAVMTQGLVGRLDQRAGAAQGAVDRVVGPLVDGEIPALGFLERDGDRLGLSFVAQILWGSNI